MVFSPVGHKIPLRPPNAVRTIGPIPSTLPGPRRRTFATTSKLSLTTTARLSNGVATASAPLPSKRSTPSLHVPASATAIPKATLMSRPI